MYVVGGRWGRETICPHVYADAQRGQAKALNPLEQSLSYPVWVLGSEPQSCSP